MDVSRPQTHELAGEWYHAGKSEDHLMPSENAAAPVSKKVVWAGRFISAVPILFLLLDGVMKLIKPAQVVQATVQLGYPESLIHTLGVLALACTILYLIPQTSILGAILLTGYLGGAVASHLRHGDPLLSHVLFPVYLGVFVWLGLYLRDPRLRDLVPFRN
jgi:DoxX-like protein